MSTETDRPSGAGLPAEMDLDELIDVLVRLRDEPDPIERAKRARYLNRHVVQGVLSRVSDSSVTAALAVPGAKPAEVAKAIGVHPSKVYGRRKVTPS